ncbi:MAG: radical SAM protein, partial [Thermodesulfovibrionia bacterium]|nr:radical SAM protein [Thermodesulfovibrionia bacterium]
MDFLIQWHLTEKCNLACSHCYQTGEENGELTSSEAGETVREISDTLSIWNKNYEIDFSPSVNLTGGEPLLRGDLFEILYEFKNIGFDTYLLTNGILVDNEKAKRLYDAGVKGVQVSIEGPEAVHESIRGKKSFSASMRGVKHLLDAGLEVTLNVTVSRLNAEYMLDMVGLASASGVHKLGFSRLVPWGRGRFLFNEMLKTAALKRLYEKVFSTDHKNGLKIVTGDPVASQFRNNTRDEDLGDTALGGCAAGVSGMTIMPDGTVVPCRRLPVSLGNVRKDSLREIWSMSDVLNDLRDRSRYKGKCGSCKKWANCRGCRAIAYSYTMARG